MRSYYKQRGLTMIEMMFVLLVIAIIIGISVPSLNSYLLKSKINEVEVDFRIMKSSISQYYLDNGDFEFKPSVPGEESSEVATLRAYLDFDTELSGNNEADKSLKEYITVNKLDPWKNPYVMNLVEGDMSFVLLLSYGPNGKKDLSSDSAGDDIIMIYYNN